MTHKETIERFQNEIDRMVGHFCMEHDLPYASAIGVLQVKIMDLAEESCCMEFEDDDEFLID